MLGPVRCPGTASRSLHQLLFVVVLLCMTVRTFGGYDEEADDALETFQEWFHGLHEVNAKVEVRETEYGKGLFATQRIREGEVVLRIPGEWVVDKARILDHAQHDPAETKLYKSLQSNDCLAAWLIIERAKGPNSDYHTWLTNLPQHFDSSLFYTKDHLRYLESRSIKADIESYVQSTKATYARLKPKLTIQTTLDDYKWAKSVLSTRAWHMEGREYLVPVAGMFNHALDAEDKSFDYTKATGKRSQKFLRYHAISRDGSAVVKSDRDCEAGEELFESYGDNKNHIYLIYHGFTPDENPYECYDLRLSKIVIQKTVSKPHEVFTTFEPSLCLHSGEVPTSLLLHAAVRTVKQDRYAECLEATSHPRRFPQKEALDTLVACANIRRAALITAKKYVLDSISSSYTTSAEEDAALLETEADPRVVGIIRYRRFKKLLAESVASAIDSKLEAAKKEAKKKTKKKKKKEKSGTARDASTEL